MSKILAFLKKVREFLETLLKIRSLWIALIGLSVAGGYYAGTPSKKKDPVQEPPAKHQDIKQIVDKAVDIKIQQWCQKMVKKYHHEDCKLW